MKPNCRVSACDVRIPVENLVAYTFLPTGPSRVFASWLVPASQLRLAMLIHPSLVKVEALGQLIYVRIAPRINYRTAITHWDHWGIEALRLVDVQQLTTPHVETAPFKADPLSVSRILFREMCHAFQNPRRIPGRPTFPRTLAAVPTNSVVEPPPTCFVLKTAYQKNLATDEAYAYLYGRLCISPRDNPSGKLLIDTRLLGSLRPRKGFPGSDEHYFELRRKRQRSHWQCRREPSFLVGEVKTVMLPDVTGALSLTLAAMDARCECSLSLATISTRLVSSGRYQPRVA